MFPSNRQTHNAFIQSSTFLPVVLMGLVQDNSKWLYQEDRHLKKHYQLNLGTMNLDQGEQREFKVSVMFKRAQGGCLSRNSPFETS